MTTPFPWYKGALIHPKGCCAVLPSHDGAWLSASCAYRHKNITVMFKAADLIVCRFLFYHIEERKSSVLAIYHLTIKIISRGKGKSAVAAAAYRAGETITNHYDGITHDYTTKGGIVFTEIMLPDHAPSEFSDRSVLWNSVEKIEKNINSQLAREIEFALPIELTKEQNISLVRDFVKHTFVNAGMCADVCIHDTGKGNPHCHIMLTMRPIDANSSWGAKSKKEYILDDCGNKIILKSGGFKTRKISATDWNEQFKADEWRAAWEDFCNAELRKHGHDVAIDRRSYEQQGIEQIPTVHLGVAATQMERKGIITEVGNRNREITVTNSHLRQLTARINKLKNWLYSQPLENSPSMIDMMNGVASGKNLKYRWQRIANLQTRAKVLMFLQNNNISDMESLANKVQQMYEQQYDVSKKIKAAERRLATLDEHFAQYKIAKQHKTVYKKWESVSSDKRDSFYRKHHGEITAYESAKKYFEGVMNGRTLLPIEKWQEERERLSAEKFSLCEQYYKLKDDVRNVEVLRRGAEGVMGVETQKERQPKAR